MWDFTCLKECRTKIFLIWNFWATSKLYSARTEVICIPTNSIQEFLFLHTVANASFLDNRHSNRCAMIWHYCFIGIYQMPNDADHFSICLLATHISFDHRKLKRKSHTWFIFSLHPFSSTQKFQVYLFFISTTINKMLNVYK